MFFNIAIPASSVPMYSLHKMCYAEGAHDTLGNSSLILSKTQCMEGRKNAHRVESWVRPKNISYTKIEIGLRAT